MMKHQTFAGLLIVLLFVSAVGTVVLALNHFFSLKQLEQARSQFVQINNTRNAMQALAADAVEYSKRNPAMEQVLQEFDAKFRTSTTNAPAAAAKPTR